MYRTTDDEEDDFDLYPRYSCSAKCCDWRGSYDEWTDVHVGECQHMTVGCAHCGQSIKRSEKEEHDEQCEQFPLQCSFCGVMTPRECMESHHEFHCPEVRVRISCCNEVIKRLEVDAHILECPEVEIYCEYVQYGCEVTPKRRDLQQHLGAHSKRHLHLVRRSHERLKHKVEKLAESLRAVQERIAPLETAVYSAL